jgi:hypothetical protein
MGRLQLLHPSQGIIILITIATDQVILTCTSLIEMPLQNRVLHPSQGSTARASSSFRMASKTALAVSLFVKE